MVVGYRDFEVCLSAVGAGAAIYFLLWRLFWCPWLSVALLKKSHREANNCPWKFCLEKVSVTTLSCPWNIFAHVKRKTWQSSFFCKWQFGRENFGRSFFLICPWNFSRKVPVTREKSRDSSKNWKFHGQKKRNGTPTLWGERGEGRNSKKNRCSANKCSFLCFPSWAGFIFGKKSESYRFFFVYISKYSKSQRSTISEATRRTPPLKASIWNTLVSKRP